MNKFRTKARAIELLGRKQIRDDITALTELMKNSHDADAEYVGVEFDLKNSNPYIILFDTGHGMTKDDILNKWLVIGTDSKKKNNGLRQSRYKKRPLMGEKGIGRLASAALGEQFWLFTKAQNEPWHTLYLNWNIFENTDMFLDDVSIPFVYDLSVSDTTSIQTVDSMKKLQKSNIENSAWIQNNLPRSKHAELYKRIKSQISATSVPDRVQDIILDIENDPGHGTVLLIQNLRLRWSDVFDNTKDRSTDYIASQRFNRLGAFIDQFAHTYDDLQVNVYVNDNLIEFNHYIDETLYEVYDVKIKGEIRAGKFFGKLFAPTASQEILDECNSELESGIDVTAGIVNWQTKDCGIFHLEFCHFERDQNNSSLTPEQYTRLTKWLETIGGIKVFRDGVRVLPYGEPENDFLNLEQRRSLHAGHYIFSHRNMFGRIMLTSKDNPDLEDKSSREGLLENEQYYYFVNTIQNLLITIARSYLSDARLGSKKLRRTYIDFNRKQKIQKAAEAKALIQENIDLADYLKQITVNYNENTKKLSALKSKEPTYKFPMVPQELRYSLLLNNFTEFQNYVQSILEEIDLEKDNLLIQINPRFKPSLKEELIWKIEDHNRNVLEYFNELTTFFTTEANLVEQKFLLKLENWKNSVAKLLKNNDLDRYRDLNLKKIQILENSLDTIKHNLSLKSKKIVEQYIEHLNNLINTHDYIDKYRLDELEFTNSHFSTLLANILKAKDLLTNIYSFNPQEIENYDLKIESLLQGSEKEIYNLERQALEHLESSLRKKISDFILKNLKEILNSFNLSFDEEIIGILKNQNESLQHENNLFSDMANFGLTAEIVNHEFNQLFINVHDGLQNLKNSGLSSSQIYWTQQIDAGFKAISSRYSQMSPMYRSYNLPKKIVRIRDMIDNISLFFNSRIEKNEIQIQNLIDADFQLKLSLSKIYPVISNLIDNSIFWLLDRPNKVLMFWADPSINTLYIEDSGPGISPRIANKIFEPFFTTRNAGRGLGLTLVKKVLESQNHKIFLVQDRSLKRLGGACFAIQFAAED